MPTDIKICQNQLILLTNRGLGRKAIAKLLGVNYSSVAKAQKRFGITSKNKASLPITNRDILIQEYTQGSGVFALAKKYGGDPENIRKRLKRVGVLDPSRANLSSGKPRRKRRLKSQEFTDATKRLRFEQEVGICQECKRSIGLHWRQATYHHIVNCKDGGTADADNCMVLHFECHNDPETFKRLHGFDIDMLLSYTG